MALYQRKKPVEEEQVEQAPADPFAELTMTDKMKMQDRYSVLVNRLTAQAEEEVSRKTDIEDRWIADLQNYHGRYDPTTENKLKAQKKSRVFVNLTRAKTNAWEARLSEMLFPTDEKNWGIKPTPNPTLGKVLGGPDGADKDQARAVIEIAKQRAVNMEREIEDQLREASHAKKARQVIHDGCVIGTGILKGPLNSAKMRRNWRPIEQAGRTYHVMEETADPMVDFLRVDPWNFFPDMSASDIADAEYTFERHLLNDKGMRNLAKMPGFDADAIREILIEGSKNDMPSYMTRLRSIGDQTQDLSGRYHVWEWRGSLEFEDLECLCFKMDDPEQLQDVKDDPLVEINAVVYFCQHRVLSFGLHYLDSGETIYSVFNLEKDETTIFGYGVPWTSRNPQASLNGAWRMMMDNAGLSTGPQVVINRDVVEPADPAEGYDLKPRKVWFRKNTPLAKNNAAFEIFNIPSQQVELGGIIALARQFFDDETNLPLIAQGEQAAHVTQTKGGMAMLMNASNVVFRRVVKNFDDDLTVPTIRRTYDYNMQFSEKQDIKGDFSIDARGSSVLLVREIQAQNLMVLMFQGAGHPVFGRLLKIAEGFRELFRAHMLNPDNFVKSDDEITKEEQAAKANPQVTPEMAKAQMEMQRAEKDGTFRVLVAKINQQTALIKLAEEKNMQISDLQATLGLEEMRLDNKERMLAAEVAAQARQQAAGNLSGGGGYV